MEEYSAEFGIHCGVSNGHGKSHDYVERTEVLQAGSSDEAYRNAMGLANEFADDYLSSPRDDLTTVRLLGLRGSEGEVDFDKEHSVAERSVLDHFLSHFLSLA